MNTYIIEIINLLPDLLCRIVKLVCSAFTRQRRLKRILSLKNTESALIIPFRQGELMDYCAVYKYATSQEVKASLNIMELLSVAGYPTCTKYEELVFGNKKYAEMALKNKMQYNYFSIGGPYGNSFACYIMRRYFPEFKMSCSKNTYNLCLKYEEPDFYIPCDDGSYYIEYKDKQGELQQIRYNAKYQSDFIVLIKMTEEDFKCKGHGTIHLIWGGRADITEETTKIFLQYEKELYKRLKNRKKHYFIVCEYCKEFGIDYENWRDITDEMFDK